MDIKVDNRCKMGESSNETQMSWVRDPVEPYRLVAVRWVVKNGFTVAVANLANKNIGCSVKF